LGGILVGDGFNSKLKRSVVNAIQKQGATAIVIAAKVDGVEDLSGVKHVADVALSGSPSVFFDAVAVLSGAPGDKSLSLDPNALAFLVDPCRHLKAIPVSGVPTLVAMTEVLNAARIVVVDNLGKIGAFVNFARNGKVWERDPVRQVAHEEVRPVNVGGRRPATKDLTD